MRISTLLALAATLCPLLSWAQGGLLATSYERADGSKGPGQLVYQPGFRSQLMLQEPTSDPGSKSAQKDTPLAPGDVRSFEVGADHYVLLHSIKLDNGMPMTFTMMKEDDFAKVLETGKIQLLEYRVFYTTSSRSASTASGRDFQANSTPVYLLRRPDENNAVMIPVTSKKYRQVLASYLVGRPDLIEKLDKKAKSEAELRALIQAYNAAP